MRPIKFINDLSGATAIEYGLIAALFSVIILVAVNFLDSPVNGLFGGIVKHFDEIGHE